MNYNGGTDETMSTNLPRLIHEYFTERMGSDRKGDGATKCGCYDHQAEFDTNGVQRDWGGDERLDQNPAGQTRHNV